MIKQVIKELIERMKSEKSIKKSSLGRVSSVSRDLSKGKVSAETIPFDPNLGQPKKEGVLLSDSRAVSSPIATTGSLAHRDKRAMMQEGGETISAEEQQEIDEQMSALMPEVDGTPIEIAEEPAEMEVPDEEMEDNYIGYILDEALDDNEEQYLLDKLNEDDQLSVIFDKVVETASEFSGSGPIEGPGSAVSDSIPARLSDGEFVMTAKATDQIGPDALQELMDLAEEEADGGRRTAQAGGLAKTEPSAIIAGVAEDERGIAVKNKEAMRLLDPRLSLFAG